MSTSQHRRFLGLPSTRLGRIAVWLIVAFAVLVALMSLEPRLVHIPRPTFLADPLEAFFVAAAAITAALAVASAVLALITRRERSVLLLAPLVVGGFACWFAAGEVLSSIGPAFYVRIPASISLSNPHDALVRVDVLSRDVPFVDQASLRLGARGEEGVKPAIGPEGSPLVRIEDATGQGVKRLVVAFNRADLPLGTPRTILVLHGTAHIRGKVVAVRSGTSVRVEP